MSPYRPASDTGFFGRMYARAKNLVSCSSGRKESPAQPPPADFEISFEDIEELDWVGSGTTGAVFEGVLDGRKVAIKKFHSASHVDIESRSDLRALSHPNVIELIGACTVPPVHCLVMELCLRSVYDVLRETKLGPALICNWARQTAHGMEYLHSQGIMHRDLKSPNILVAQDEKTLKISDFGTASDIGTRSHHMSFCGSVPWMAPEMIRGDKCSQMVDVWSFGVVLWELLVGHVPYGGVDTAAILYGVGTGQKQLPVPSTTPLGFSLLLKQCWNQNPKHRPLFRQVLLHLQIVEDDSGFLEIPSEDYFETQDGWKKELADQFSTMKIDPAAEALAEEQKLVLKREQELKHAEEVRQLYEERLLNASTLLVELKSQVKKMQGRQSGVSVGHHRRTKPKHHRRTSKPGFGKHTVGRRTNHSRHHRSGSGSRGSGGSGSLGWAASSGHGSPVEGAVAPAGSKADQIRRSLDRALIEGTIAKLGRNKLDEIPYKSPPGTAAKDSDDSDGGDSDVRGTSNAIATDSAVEHRAPLQNSYKHGLACEESLV